MLAAANPVAQRERLYNAAYHSVCRARTKENF